MTASGGEAVGWRCECVICGPTSRTYKCRLCERRVPWHFGAASDDGYDDACDDCWYFNHATTPTASKGAGR